MVVRILVALALMSAGSAAAQQADPPDPISALVLRLEAAAASGDVSGILALSGDTDVPALRELAWTASLNPTRVIIKERDRSTIATGGERLLLEVFAEFGMESAITTWRMDVDAQTTRVTSMERLSSVSGLYRLALNPERQFDVRSLRVTGIDLTLDLPSGSAFVAETREGTTGVVLLGRGRMRFAPSDAAERTQVRIFSGEESLETDFDAVFIRLRPSDFDRYFDAESLVPRPVVPNDLRRATEVFDEYVGHTLHLDLTDLSRERWSLIPGAGDLIVEVRTRRFGGLTYTRSTRDAEDVSLFDRRRRRNIAVYASPQKMAARGRFYSDEDLVDYDVLHYDVEAVFSPERLWIDGRTRIRLRTTAYALATLTLRLAEPLAVRSIISLDHGRLLHLRVVGQNSVIVNLPTTLARGTELQLQVIYGGRLQPQRIDGEGLTPGQQQEIVRDQIYIPIEASYLYSNRSYWYPQSTVTDYATARLQITVPPDYDAIATGVPIEVAPSAAADREPSAQPGNVAVFEAEHPTRYLACVISRFVEVYSTPIAVSPSSRLTGSGGDPASTDATLETSHSPAGSRSGASDVMLRVFANPRQAGRSRAIADRAVSIFEYYGSLLGEAPYPGFTLALAESELPGGHSPGYFALLNQPLPLVQATWRNDPVAFDGYAPFFLAHEIAHQWWGQGVGWKNYHEQWLSEGFAQYFALLYATQDRGDDLQVSMLRQMRRWAMEQSSQGPVYLGYRLGHIRNDGRVFRALVYNKGAMVLHMLRRLVGDEAFFEGLRAFYTGARFTKAGTDDFRQTMEKVSGRALSEFFDAWIYGAEIPSLGFQTTLSARELRVRFEHRREVAPVPVTVSIVYRDGRTDDFVVAVTEQVVERTLPLTGSVRSVDVNRDYAALADISRRGGGVGVRIGALR